MEHKYIDFKMMKIDQSQAKRIEVDVEELALYVYFTDKTTPALILSYETEENLMNAAKYIEEAMKENAIEQADLPKIKETNN